MSLTAGLVAFNTRSCRVNRTGGLSTEHYFWDYTEKGRLCEPDTDGLLELFRQAGKTIICSLFDKVE